MRKNEIQERSYEFALRIIKLVLALPDNVAGRRLGDQLLRAGTSIGANVEEGIGGYSKNDFASKMSIAYKEARESNYWLRLIRDSNLMEVERMQLIIEESEEIVKMLFSIVKSSKNP